MKFMFFGIIFAAILLEHASCDCSALEVQTLSKCFDNYLYDMGVENVGYLEEWTYDDIESLSGINELCKNYEALQTCLGNKVSPYCFSFNGFNQTSTCSTNLFDPNGHDMLGAYECTQLFFQTQFICAKGKSEYSCGTCNTVEDNPTTVGAGTPFNQSTTTSSKSAEVNKLSILPLLTVVCFCILLY